MKKAIFCVLFSLVNQYAFSQQQDTLFAGGIQEILALPIAEKDDDAVTTASRKAESFMKAPAVMTVITAKEIEAFGAYNLDEVMDRVVGMYNAGAYYTPQGILSVRGTITTHYNVQVLCLLNGRPMRDVLNNGYIATLYRGFPLESIERIEIIRGSGSVLYGSNAYRAVINIITKPLAQNTEASVKVRYGTFGTWQLGASVGKKIGQVEVQAHVFQNNSNGWEYWATDEKKVIQSIRMNDFTKTGMVEVKYKDLKFQHLSVASQNNEMSVSSIWSPPNIHHANRMVQHYTDLSYRKQKDKWDFNVHLDYNYSLRQLLETATAYDTRASEMSANGILGEASVAYKPTKNLSIQVGGTSQYAIADIKHFFKTSKGKDFNLYTGTNTDPFIDADGENETWYTGYFQASYSPFSFLNLDMGGQFNKTASPLDFVPRLNAVFHVKDKLFFKLMYGSAFRSPSLFERYVGLGRGIDVALAFPIAGGGTKLNPEKITSAEIQLAYKHKFFQATATVFHSEEHSIITRSLPSDSLIIKNGQKFAIPQYINRGTLTTEGLEIETKVTLSKKIFITGSFSSVKVGDGTPQTTFGMPNVMFKTGIAYQPKKGISLALFNSYFSAGDPIGEKFAYNNPVKAFNYLSANIRFDLKTLYEASLNKRGLILEFYGMNLLNENINYAEFVRRQVNAFQGRGGIAFYMSLKYSL